MTGDTTLLVPVLFPAAAGLFTAFFSVRRKRGAGSKDEDGRGGSGNASAAGRETEARKEGENRPLLIWVAAALSLSLLLTLWQVAGDEKELLWFSMTRDLPILFKMDLLSRLFAGLIGVMWLLAGIFSFSYMAQEEHLGRYYAFYLLSLGALNALRFSGNYETLYFAFELMTLFSLPLVLHEGNREARAAGIRYVTYSILGAALGLLGLFFLSRYGTTLTFTPGGVLDPAKASAHEGLLQTVLFLTVVGFGAKAGLFPLHRWLPVAHPAAPAPASAVLSGVITKAGVLAILRVIFYQAGADFLRGTWVQYALCGLALGTVFLGSMMAFRETVLKKRLAYSTVSQVSYVLFGIFLLNGAGLSGALLHVVFHSVIKDCLFLCAGAVIHVTGKTDVRDLKGVGHEMPLILGCFTAASLALIGIPPFGGFVSKWDLALGSLQSGLPVLCWLGPAVLLVSAALTAGYLLPVAGTAFFPGRDHRLRGKREPGPLMTVPVLLLAAACLVLGLFPGPLAHFGLSVAETLGLGG